jgi:hypothetical protein
MGDDETPLMRHETTLVIQYDKNHYLGGLGDRIIGLISIKLISKLLKKNFCISWTKENIKKYLNYEKYDYELLRGTKNNVKVCDSIDNQTKLKKYLMTSTILFPYGVTLFRLNTEVSQYLYRNRLFKRENYFRDILNEYRSLYTDILIPTDYLLDRVDKLVAGKRNIVGIQVRCGDVYMNARQIYVTGYAKNVGARLTSIKCMCERKFGGDYSVFFTTDNAKIVSDVYDAFGKSRVIYEDSCIQHLDRKSVDPDMAKVFIDNYILSQRTMLLLISTNSNFGRVAALSSNHSNIYSFIDCRPVDKKGLLSKQESWI